MYRSLCYVSTCISLCFGTLLYSDAQLRETQASKRVKDELLQMAREMGNVREATEELIHAGEALLEERQHVQPSGVARPESPRDFRETSTQPASNHALPPTQVSDGQWDMPNVQQRSQERAAEDGQSSQPNRQARHNRPDDSEDSPASQNTPLQSASRIVSIPPVQFQIYLDGSTWRVAEASHLQEGEEQRTKVTHDAQPTLDVHQVQQGSTSSSAQGQPLQWQSMPEFQAPMMSPMPSAQSSKLPVPLYPVQTASQMQDSPQMLQMLSFPSSLLPKAPQVEQAQFYQQTPQMQGRQPMFSIPQTPQSQFIQRTLPMPELQYPTPQETFSAYSQAAPRVQGYGSASFPTDQEAQTPTSQGSGGLSGFQRLSNSVHDFFSR